MIESLAIGAITVAMSILGSYAIVKRGFSDEALLEKAEFLMDNLLQNEETQKKIYTTGALLGKGLIDGTGLKGKATGKRGLEGMVMEIIGNYIGSKMMPNSEQPKPQFGQLG